MEAMRAIHLFFLPFSYGGGSIRLAVSDGPETAE